VCRMDGNGGSITFSLFSSYEMMMMMMMMMIDGENKITIVVVVVVTSYGVERKKSSYIISQGELHEGQGTDRLEVYISM